MDASWIRAIVADATGWVMVALWICMFELLMNIGVGTGAVTVFGVIGCLCSMVFGINIDMGLMLVCTIAAVYGFFACIIMGIILTIGFIRIYFRTPEVARQVRGRCLFSLGAYIGAILIAAVCLLLYEYII